jgi:hypothetical protein
MGSRPWGPVAGSRARHQRELLPAQSRPSCSIRTAQVSAFCSTGESRLTMSPIAMTIQPRVGLPSPTPRLQFDAGGPPVERGVIHGLMFAQWHVLAVCRDASNTIRSPRSNRKPTPNRSTMIRPVASPTYTSGVQAGQRSSNQTCSQPSIRTHSPQTCPAAALAAAEPTPDRGGPLTIFLASKTNIDSRPAPGVPHPTARNREDGQ